jgi:hypothetical protein
MNYNILKNLTKVFVIIFTICAIFNAFKLYESMDNSFEKEYTYNPMIQDVPKELVKVQNYTFYIKLFLYLGIISIFIMFWFEHKINPEGTIYTKLKEMKKKFDKRNN